jgi:hypothetical protein
LKKNGITKRGEKFTVSEKHNESPAEMRGFSASKEELSRAKIYVSGFGVSIEPYFVF